MRLSPGAPVVQPRGRALGSGLPWRELWGAGDWIAIVGGLLGGRAFGLSGVVAFALAWPLAQRSRKGSVDAWSWGALVAAATGAAWGAGPRPALALLLVGSGLLLTGAAWPRRGMGAWLPSMAAAALISLLDRGGRSPWAAGGLALVEGLLVPVAVYAAATLFARWARTGPNTSTGHGPAPVERIAAAAALGVCAAGLAGLSAAIDVRALLVGAAVMWDTADPGLGAAAGGVAGWVAALTGGVGVVAPASAALGGALAAWLGPWRRWGAAAGVAAGAVLAVGLAGAGLPWCWGTLAFACAAAIYTARPRAPRMVRAEEGPPPRAGGAAWLHRLRACARACLELSRGLAQVASSGQEPTTPEREGLQVAEEVCPGCPSLRACWERRLPRARRMVDEVWAAASSGGVHWQQVGGTETIYCLRPREMAEVANRHAALVKQRQELGRLLAASRRSAVAPLLGIGRTLTDLADEAAAAIEPSGPASRASGAGLPAHPTQARWRATAGEQCWGYAAVAAGLARPGKAVSGDAYRCRLLPDDRLALVLSDGMGSGPLAAVASASAAEHTLAWLAAGCSPLEALRRTNGWLLEDGEAERFATVDLAIVELRTGQLEWFKMAAPPGFLCHARGVRECPGGGLPAGILPEPEIRTIRARLRSGDTLVLVSDGVLDLAPVGGTRRAGRRGRWAVDWLRGRMHAWEDAGGDLEALATELVGAAARRIDEQGDHDDMTALVVRLLAPGTAGGSSHG